VKEKIIVALDFEDLEDAINICRELKDSIKIFKIGWKLFINYGYDSISYLKKEGVEVFLDLKFHDIPYQIGGVCRKIVEMGIRIFTCHALGGYEMMKEISRLTDEYAKKLQRRKPEIFGVTLLTSLNEKDIQSFGFQSDTRNICLQLAYLAQKAGLTGVVASPLELNFLRSKLNKDFKILTPGIRLETHRKEDQKRFLTPGEALRHGASYIVIGRPVTKAKNPKEELLKIIDDMKGKQV
jgi:orotidine-5'-phosphate decarboxylase